MACNRGSSKKKKIAILSAAGAGATGTLLTLSIGNPAMAGFSAFLPLLICPAACIAVGGSMWLIPRLVGSRKGEAKERNPHQYTSAKRENLTVAKESQEQLSKGWPSKFS